MNNLNPAQKAAVNCPINEPVLVLAPAGSGKTTVLTQRVKALISSGVWAGNITVVTFSKAAAKELTHRIPYHHLAVSTIHSLALTVLRVYTELKGLPDFKVLNAHAQDLLLNQLQTRYQVKAAELDLYIQQAKMGVAPPATKKMREAYKDYLDTLTHRNTLDFTDLVIHAVAVLRNDPLLICQLATDYMLVDEFQDTDNLQWELIQLLCPSNRIFAVGDDDQSIYAFRGADLRPFNSFAQIATCYKLEVNYRSTPAIVNLANHLIKPLRNRLPKTMVAATQSDVPVTFMVFQSEAEQAAWLKAQPTNGSSAVLYRSNWLKPAGTPAGTMPHTLSTVHAAKGLEWDTVYLVGTHAGAFPAANASISEERRLAYVAVTRARKQLVICYVQSVNYFGTQKATQKGIFLQEILPHTTTANLVLGTYKHPAYGEGEIIQQLSKDVFKVRFESGVKVLRVSQN